MALGFGLWALDPDATVNAKRKLVIPTEAGDLQGLAP